MRALNRFWGVKTVNGDVKNGIGGQNSTLGTLKQALRAQTRHSHTRYQKRHRGPKTDMGAKIGVRGAKTGTGMQN